MEKAHVNVRFRIAPPVEKRYFLPRKPAAYHFGILAPQAMSTTAWLQPFKIPSHVLQRLTRRRWQKASVHLARAPMGSHAGRTIGSCSITAKTSSGTCFLSTTASYTYSENQSSVMRR